MPRLLLSRRSDYGGRDGPNVDVDVDGHHKVKSEAKDRLIRYDSSTRVWRELPAERK